ncbi:MULTISPECIES: oligopeptidase A [Cycloclasticus]|jgi:oligopeptidase A|uniref:oligopeptidase A n=1 Tax=Cycloclasticus zancles 78-ME TaxID=1198232 RepID=S5TCZ7_9GAMM|nr:MULTISPECIES: oligopeptidase A [Cycloclasticus]AFT68123.1 Peptidase family M3 [Cycloclasticus sp. P1]AGS38677.1 Oligopeptidase A [Cycloclasticus zancles 78-ME]
MRKYFIFQLYKNMTNPLLEEFELPHFSEITAADIEPAINEVLAKNKREIASLLEGGKEYSWENLVHPIELMDDYLNRVWSPVSHLNSVMNNDEWREAYSNCLPKLSEYSTEIGQNKELYLAYLSIKKGAEYKVLSTAQKKIIDNALRDFELSGVALPSDKKQRYMDISQQLSTLTNQFEENLMDATNDWSQLVTDEADLQGLPASAMDLLRQTAQQKDQDGWMLTLEFPCYMAIMTYADNRELRYAIHHAFVTRASDRGTGKESWDNSQLMKDIVGLRHEKAQLLGYKSYAHLSLATKMADKPEDVLTFLNQLADSSLPMAKKDYATLCDFAAKQGHKGAVESWDVAYYSEKLRQERYQFSQEEVKPYFPANRVLTGMFKVVEKLYGLNISEVKDVNTWHKDVQLFSITDEKGVHRGRFFIDLFARPHKRGGAWMDECVTRFKKKDGVQTPVAYLTCNFTPPIGEDPSLLTHGEVETLFHEFGHGLHHMLTQVDYLSVSGIHGVEWDAVELPSQFMENWCWQAEVMPLISGHYKTGEVLPQEIFEKMLAAKNFQSGMQMVRQIEFSIFDFRIHLEYDATNDSQIYDVLEQVRADVSVVKTPEFNRFPNSFSHIFAGGYAAGYYSYKWAEVLSSDAFSLFEEKGIFDEQTGRSFLHNILEKGGSDDALELFTAFRGRKPTIDALLKHSGIAA